MKQIIMLVIFLSMFSVLFFSSVSCKKKETPKAVITVERPDGVRLVGAQVVVYSNPNGSNISDTLVTNETGQVTYEAKNECILNVKVEYKKTVNQQQLFYSGTGLLILKLEQTYYETIITN